jgi:hypothetical protein
MDGIDNRWRPMRHEEFYKWSEDRLADPRQVYALDTRTDELIWMPDGRADDFRARAKARELVCPVPSCPSPTLNTRGGRERRHHFYHVQGAPDSKHDDVYSQIAAHHVLKGWLAEQDSSIAILPDRHAAGVPITLLAELPEGKRVALCYVNYVLGAEEWCERHLQIDAQDVAVAWMFAPLRRYCALPEPKRPVAHRDRDTGSVVDHDLYRKMRSNRAWPLILSIERQEIANLIPVGSAAAKRLGLYTPFDKARHIVASPLAACRLCPDGIATPAVGSRTLDGIRHPSKFKRSRSPRRNQSRFQRSERPPLLEEDPPAFHETYEPRPEVQQTPKPQPMPEPDVDPPQPAPSPQPRPRPDPVPRAIRLPIKPGVVWKVIGFVAVVLFLKSFWSAVSVHVQSPPTINARSKNAPALLKAAASVYPDGECQTNEPQLGEVTLAVRCSATSPAGIVTYEQIAPNASVSGLDHDISAYLSENDIPISCNAFGSTKWRLAHANTTGVVVCDEDQLLWCDRSAHLVGHIERTEGPPSAITSFWPQALTAQHSHAGAPVVDKAASKRNVC